MGSSPVFSFERKDRPPLGLSKILGRSRQHPPHGGVRCSTLAQHGVNLAGELGAPDQTSCQSMPSSDLLHLTSLQSRSRVHFASYFCQKALTIEARYSHKAEDGGTTVVVPQTVANTLYCEIYAPLHRQP